MESAIKLLAKYNLEPSVEGYLNNFLSLPEETITNVIFLTQRSWMLNTLVKSASELQLRNSRLFSILDPQTYGYHPTAVGPQPVGSIKPIKVLPQAHSKRMEPNFQSSMVPGVLRLSSVKTLLSLPECKLRMFNSERPPLYQVK